MGVRSQTPKASGGWGPRPQNPVCDTFEKHELSQHVPKVRYLQFLTISLSPLPLQNPGYVQTSNNDFRSYESFVPQALSLWKNFDNVISCDLWFRPPQSKNPGYANELKIAWKKIFGDLYFLFWRTLAPVSLVLASSIPILGLERFYPRKGCPWPWPRIFFVSLALASSLVSSTPPLIIDCVCYYYIIQKFLNAILI